MNLQFTRQQLVGGGKYQPKTRIGNWNEDIEQNEYKFSKYLEAKENGQLVSHRLAKKSNRARQRVPLTFKPDGEPIRFGDSIMLGSKHSGQFLSVEYSDKKAWKLWTTEARSPMACNVFIVTRASEENPDDDGILRYGQPFCLTSEPALRAQGGTMLPPYWVQAGAKTLDWAIPAHAFDGLVVGSAGSPGPADMASTFSQNAVFVVEPESRNDEGWMAIHKALPVTPGASIVLMHRQHNSALCVTGKARKVEGKLCHEVFSNSVRRTPTAAQVFSFVCSSSEAAGIDRRNFAALDVADVWVRVRELLGSDGINDAIAEFEKLGCDSRGSLTRSEVEEAFACFRLPIHSSFMDVLLDSLCSKGSSTTVSAVRAILLGE